MLSKTDRKKLAEDFRGWGKGPVRRIARLTRKHGVLCSGETFSTGKKG